MNATIPPLEALNRSEGVLSFSGSTQRHRYLTVLKEDDGTTHKFSCKAFFSGDSNSCGTRDYADKHAVVWWHLLELHPVQTIEHAVQIEVDGKIILTYEWSREKLASAKTDDPWFALGTTIFFMIILVIFYKIERRRYEQRND